MITPSVSTKEMYALLQTLLQIDMPLFIHGSPGIGKSYIVNDIAIQNGWQIIDVRLSLLDAVDLRGVPSIVDGKSVWMPPVFLPDNECDGILFLDELNSAPQSVQVAIYQLILDRKIGEYTLPKGWRIVCAGNKISDRGVVFRLPSPLANRMAHILLKPTFEDFKVWAIQNNLHPFVIGFLGFRPDLLSSESPKDNEANPAFATPRSWTMLSRVLFESGGEIHSISPIVYGLVGFGAGVEFVSYAKVYEELPDVELILLLHQ
jgi:hypothetical protein